MLSPTVLLQGLYYARFIWYLEIDQLYNHHPRYIASTRCRKVGHSWQATTEYHRILARTVDYILSIVELQETMLLQLHQVMQMHFAADCFDQVAWYVQYFSSTLPFMKSGGQGLYTPTRLFDPVMLRRINPKMHTTWSMPKNPLLLFDLVACQTKAEEKAMASLVRW